MSWVTRGLARAAVFFSRTAKAFVYLGIGTLRLSAVRDSSRALWDGFNDAPEDVAAGLSPVETDLFGRWLPPASRILVVGAGSGRDLIALGAQGHRLTGVEPSPSAVALNRRFLSERRLEAALIEGFFEDVDLTGPFDAVVFSYFCYSYIPVAARRVQVLRKAAALLAPAGRVFVSYTAAGRPHALLPRLGNLTAALTRSDWRLEPGDSVSLRFERPAPPLFFFEHAFVADEAIAEVAAAGLEILHHRTGSDYPWIVCGAPIRTNRSAAP
jgi:SAM-dependent methyltransferase